MTRQVTHHNVQRQGTKPVSINLFLFHGISERFPLIEFNPHYVFSDQITVLKRRIHLPSATKV